MKNKALIIATIILLTIVIFFLIMFLVVTLKSGTNFNGMIFGMKSKTTNKVYDNEFKLEDVKNINIKQDAGDITIRETSNDDIKVELYGNEENDVQVDINEGHLKIDFTHKRIKFIYFGGTKNDIIIYIPSSYLGTIKIENDLGNCEIEDLENATIDIECDAGNVELGKIKNATVKCDLGEIDIQEVLNKCDVKSDCGNIEINQISIKENSTISSNLGNININNTNDIYIDPDVDLGKVKINNSNRNSDITLKISSDCGNITINN